MRMAPKGAMKKIRLREMPHLEFVTDRSLKAQGELLGAINRATEATAESESTRDDDDAPTTGVDDAAPRGNDAPTGPGDDDPPAPDQEPQA